MNATFRSLRRGALAGCSTTDTASPYDPPPSLRISTMSYEPPLEDFVDINDTLLHLENVFKHPRGLSTAQNLVKVLATTMEDKVKGPQPSQRQISKAFSISRPISASNPAMPNFMKERLAFSDSHLQTSGKGKSGTRDLFHDSSNSLETGERCKTIHFSPAKVGGSCSDFQADIGATAHIKLSSNATSLHDAYPVKGYSPHIKQHDSSRNSYSEHTFSTDFSSCILDPTDRTSSPFIVDPQLGDQVEANRVSELGRQYSRASDKNNDNSHYSVPSLSTITQQLNGRPSFSSDFSSIDRDFLGFNHSSSRSQTHSSHHPTTNSHPSAHSPSKRAQHHSFGYRNPESRRLQTPHSSAMPSSHKASPSPEDSELLQVVEMPTAMDLSISSEDTRQSFSSSITQPQPTSPNLTDKTMQIATKKKVSRKRKINADGELVAKKQKSDKTIKPKRIPNPKAGNKEPVSPAYHFRDEC